MKLHAFRPWASSHLTLRTRKSAFYDLYVSINLIAGPIPEGVRRREYPSWSGERQQPVILPGVTPHSRHRASNKSVGEETQPLVAVFSCSLFFFFASRDTANPGRELYSRRPLAPRLIKGSEGAIVPPPKSNSCETAPRFRFCPPSDGC